MKPTILVIEDQKINRAILKKNLEDEFAVLEAENGLEALSLLDEHEGEVDGILLDLVMPVMDGHEFLARIRGSKYAGVPIIVLTGEANHDIERKVIENGAWDFITKPYDTVILSSRLKNAIARSQIGMFNQIRYMAEHDQLTGLYNRVKFFSEVQDMVDDMPDRTFALARVDIEQFSIINSFWGDQEGNRLLNHMANVLIEECRNVEGCLYGRINADVFGFSLPYEENSFYAKVRAVNDKIKEYASDYFIKPVFGIYIIHGKEIDDKGDKVDVMFEKASSAARKCKGDYNRHIGYYDAEMEHDLLREQMLVNSMEQALAEEQFIVWLQPKYELRSERPCGSEALIRWIHPQYGMMSPGRFIPAFEKNGFITRLYLFVWEKVCGLLRKWIDEGRDPVPVSVNLSRNDMYNPNIVEILCGLVSKYGISPGLLNLEITESAYMDNPEIMELTVHKLQERGFVILMDDFGSGYSSLNMLKDIPVDILKIDMNFLRDSEGSKKSKIILASVIMMAGWLNLPVIVEGVEKKSHVDFLKSIGSKYVQGYYFGKPMPVEDYEDLMYHNKMRQPVECEDTSVSDFVWMNDNELQKLFDFMNHPFAICEFLEGSYYPIRSNHMYDQMFGEDGYALTGESEKLIESFCRGLGGNIHAGTCEIECVNAENEIRKMATVIDYIGEVQGRKIYVFNYGPVE